MMPSVVAHRRRSSNVTTFFMKRWPPINRRRAFQLELVTAVAGGRTVNCAAVRRRASRKAALYFRRRLMPLIERARKRARAPHSCDNRSTVGGFQLKLKASKQEIGWEEKGRKGESVHRKEQNGVMRLKEARQNVCKVIKLCGVAIL